ncbi:MAG: hypothetical protein MUO91_05180 [candidate division Zixibacteria bacterium]|nr:hypothetical protein [candidate division Zixibacteria bacterium]
MNILPTFLGNPVLRDKTRGDVDQQNRYAHASRDIPSLDRDGIILKNTCGKFTIFIITEIGFKIWCFSLILGVYVNSIV